MIDLEKLEQDYRDGVAVNPRNVRALMDELRALRAEVERLAAELAQARARNDELYHELEETQADRNVAQSKLDDTRAAFQQAIREIADLYQAIHDMDNARLEIRRDLEAVIIKTGNAYRPKPPIEGKAGEG